MKREPGYYWVRLTSKEWIIARWNKIYWVISIFAEDYYIETKVFYDSELSEIDERRIERFSAIENNQAYYAGNKFAEDWWKNELKDPPRYLSDNPYLCE